MQERQVDIAIIGAGVVGLATALSLAPTGFRLLFSTLSPNPVQVPKELRSMTGIGG